MQTKFNQIDKVKYKAGILSLSSEAYKFFMFHHDVTSRELKGKNLSENNIILITFIKAATGNDDFQGKDAFQGCVKNNIGELSNIINDVLQFDNVNFDASDDLNLDKFNLLNLANIDDTFKNYFNGIKRSAKKFNDIYFPNEVIADYFSVAPLVDTKVGEDFVMVEKSPKECGNFTKELITKRDQSKNEDLVKI